MPNRPTLSPLPMSRRNFLGSSAVAAIALTAAKHAQAATNAHHDSLTKSEGWSYEIQRSDDDWRAMLTEDEYKILRKGGTELPKTSPLWKEERAGMYHCKGCELEAYDGRWKVPLDKGWVFFTHSQTNAVLTGIDGPVAEYGSSMSAGPGAFVEVHCRRCGSHLGHLLPVDGHQVHCINGSALHFYPDSA